MYEDEILHYSGNYVVRSLNLTKHFTVPYMQFTCNITL